MWKGLVHLVFATYQSLTNIEQDFKAQTESKSVKVKRANR